MTEDPKLEDLIAKMFIMRTDVKAIQNTAQTYMPVISPWKRADIARHLAGEATYGHYLLNKENRVKLFALDLDLLAGEGNLPDKDLNACESSEEWERSFGTRDLRAAWTNRRDPARTFMKAQMRQVAGQLMRKIYDELGLHTACAYSGSKGLHIYGFTGPMSALDAREAAEIVLDMCGWRIYKGQSKYKFHLDDPIVGYAQYDIEVYPKQTSLDAKGFGSLMRLPLGVNRKSPKDPTFFLDVREAMSVWKPRDPIEALTCANPWTD